MGASQEGGNDAAGLTRRARERALRGPDLPPVDSNAISINFGLPSDS